MSGKPGCGRGLTAQVQIRVTPDEKAAYVKAAGEDGLSEWFRGMANRACRRYKIGFVGEVKREPSACGHADVSNGNGREVVVVADEASAAPPDAQCGPASETPANAAEGA